MPFVSLLRSALLFPPGRPGNSPKAASRQTFQEEARVPLQPAGRSVGGRLVFGYAHPRAGKVEESGGHQWAGVLPPLSTTVPSADVVLVTDRSTQSQLPEAPLGMSTNRLPFLLLISVC